MKEYLKEHLFQFISLIPVCFIAIGAFILNIYLYQFGIIDVALFDSKTIFIGFVAILQIICYFFLFCIFFGVIKMEHGPILFVINMLWKPVLFAIIVYSFLGNGDNLELMYSGWRYYLLRVLMAISIVAFFGLLGLNIKFDIPNLKSKKYKRLVYTVIGLELCSTYSVNSILFEDHIFQEICETYMILSILCVIFAIILIYGKFPLVNKETGISCFKLGDKPMYLDYYCAYCLVIVFFMIALSLYSTRVFPHISNNLGGGFYKFNTIVFEDDSTTTGKIIYNNSNYVYIIEEENQLSQFPIDKIKRYVFMERQNNDSNVYEEPVLEIINDEILDFLE
jgi:hypothetical protein